MKFSRGSNYFFPSKTTNNPKIDFSNVCLNEGNYKERKNLPFIDFLRVVFAAFPLCFFIGCF